MIHLEQLFLTPAFVFALQHLGCQQHYTVVRKGIRKPSDKKSR